ncbi:uncharacterized protein B0P05DRAFT_556689 [Gilbertella persicaria]|uniref:uncharacterized protein n=1 Tax=Gilbertella persicaria TaxID=101096 RepID=UPI00221F19ED|nr:uncharacterized protein B0P05DRAFT_556689 [Gilbertella persicaria]KAI8062370.1 hypothetical protein B0P05DRAFT_556689 [Gilbertella persicaria]
MRLPFLLLLGFCAISNTAAQVVTSSSAVPVATSNAAATGGGAVTASSTLGSASAQPTSATNGSSIINNNGTTITNSTAAAGNNSVAALPTSASYGNSVYPGSVSFIAPTASKSVSPLYRIDSKENVTFSWSFTNLLVQPQNLTLAAVAPNSVTYTIGALSGVATSAVWHISDVPAASPLMMGMYQIQLYDQRGLSAYQSPGWLAPNTRLTIAFYSAESYSQPTGSDYCPLCFYNAGRKMAESFGPIAVAFGVAGATTVMMLYGLLY